jgi:hypothetical protein
MSLEANHKLGKLTVGAGLIFASALAAEQGKFTWLLVLFPIAFLLWVMLENLAKLNLSRPSRMVVFALFGASAVKTILQISQSLIQDFISEMAVMAAVGATVLWIYWHIFQILKNLEPKPSWNVAVPIKFFVVLGLTTYA